MKKSLIALAALAATGAFAQSSVTLYGRAEAGVDLGFRTKVDSTNTTVIVGPGASTTNTNLGSSVSKPGFRISDGDNQGQASSRFGMRGSEDLGGGLRANFVLEAGVTLDDGAAGTGGGNFFSQSAWVGLSGGFGEVRLGRQVLGSFDVYASGLSAAWGSGLYEVGATFVQGGDVRASNAIQYRSPDFGGISGTVSLLAPETNRSTSTPVVGGNSTTSSSNKTGVDLSVAYAAGPVYVGFGYNKQTPRHRTTTVWLAPRMQRPAALARVPTTPSALHMISVWLSHFSTTPTARTARTLLRLRAAWSQTSAAPPSMAAAKTPSHASTLWA